MERVCDVCISPNIYHFKREINGPFIQACQDCDATAVCHPDTTIPVEKMKSGFERNLRVVARDTFNSIWKRGYMGRNDAIEWMGNQLHLRERFHLRNCNDFMLRQVINISNKFLKGSPKKKQRNPKHANKRPLPDTAKHNAIWAERRRDKRWKRPR